MAEKIYVKDILECQQSNVRMIKQATWSIIRSSKWRERNILLCQSIVKIRISTTIQNVYGLYMCNMYVLPYHLGRVCFCEKPLQQQKVTKLGTINARSESNCMALQQNDSRSQNAFEHPLLRVIICKKIFQKWFIIATIWVKFFLFVGTVLFFTGREVDFTLELWRTHQNIKWARGVRFK